MKSRGDVDDVLHRIIHQATRDPDQLAVKDLSRELTYSELLDEVAAVASGLTTKGVGEGDRVAIHLANSTDFVVAALACLWIGAVFVPLAVSDPALRQRDVVRDCAPLLIIAPDTDADATPLPFDEVESVSLNSLRHKGDIRGPVAAGDRAAYMIYTSGTTGTPKGVLIGTRSFAAAVTSTAEAVGMTRDTRTLSVSPFHFDGSYANLFPTLISGGTVVIRPRDALLFARVFFNTVESESITYSGFTPSYLRLLLSDSRSAQLASSTLTTIALGGESVSVRDLKTLRSRAPDMRIFNRYGPTETTIAVTNLEVTLEMLEKRIVPIGYPHPGVTFYLVDDAGGLISGSNEVGELYIGGNQLMEGYWAAPELTSQVLRRDIVPEETVYRSGDLVYRDDVGRYVYVARADRVIKRSGVRISLVELNESLQRIPTVAAAWCATFDNGGELGIVAFLVTTKAEGETDLRRAALDFIPDTMMPNQIDVVHELLLDRSNKIDERRLLEDAHLSPWSGATT
jgi:amino acid adenylation domain-containing protein